MKKAFILSLKDLFVKNSLFVKGIFASADPEFNLLFIVERDLLRRKIFSPSALFFLIIILLFLLQGISVAQKYILKDLQSKINYLKPRLELIRNYDNENKKSEEIAELYKKTNLHNRCILNLLSDLQVFLPSEVWLESLLIDAENKVIIRGSSESLNSVDKIKEFTSRMKVKNFLLDSYKKENKDGININSFVFSGRLE